MIAATDLADGLTLVFELAAGLLLMLTVAAVAMVVLLGYVVVRALFGRKG